MKSNSKGFFVLKIVAGLLIISITMAVYISQLNQMVTHNMLNTISELAHHDKRSIEAFIETSWDELEGMAQRFATYRCETILEMETRMNLECATSDFSHIYLLAEDGKIYTDKYVVYDPAQDTLDRQVDLRPYFSNGEDRVVTRWDDKAEAAGMSREYVLYGVRLEDFEVDGIKMRALIGLSDTNTIQRHIVLDSFLKDGVRRGYCAVVSTSGEYVIGIQKTLYLNEVNNFYHVLSAGTYAELTNEQIAQKLENSETFSFHYTDVDGVGKLLYFTPFDGNIDWYFMMVVESRAFTERSQAFAILSVAMLVIVMLVATLLLLALTASHYKTVQAVARAKSQSEFLSNMSHEIRTPLNGLIGLNHLMMTRIGNPGQEEQVKDWLRKSHSTANYLLSLVNDVLDMSKLQAGKVDLISEPILVETLVDAIWSMQRDNIESREVQFVVEQEIPVPCVMGDSTRIKQVLMNIVGNAAKFTSKGGCITLSVSQEKTDETHVTTIYRCQDTGVGMSKEFVERIFDAFSQERNKNSDSVKGTGLGMAISKLLVDAMGGEIRVESELNVGTVFTVSLPAEIADAESEYADQCFPQMLAEDHPAHPGRPVKVLMAEDNELNAEILMDILTDEGFEVVHAENGQEAVRRFAESSPGEFDIILMDMQMPVLDGCSAAMEIRSLNRPDAKTVVIFACTANTFKEDRDRAVESGMNDFLAKPIDVNVLLNKLSAGGASTSPNTSTKF